ncbi:cytochrome c oxidase subunit II [Cellulosimicrobium arenosum]|uniref:Nitrous-oxide reductase n=1 Tax=Cellulosimicrobium arenosum TaxID=2708133 RepID=A0A927IYN2_9MICO|nr:cytochrome c oxidase subunit II [Cellulosimicrobium arenosum]MBD8077559.1 cytochrome c oxidase subunit II [Cellulosimicrobium arenosum]
MHSQSPSRTRRTILRATALAVAVAAVASGCASDTVQRGYLPGYDDGEVTDQTARITSLWTGSWIAALVVGVITWGLMLWCIAAYRKRKDDHVLPVQTRYHLPLEIMYTAVPILMILVLFVFTDRDINAIQDPDAESDITIEVIGKQWSWDFNYVDEDVYESGEQVTDVAGTLTEDAEIDGVPGTSEEMPTLYLPVDETVKFELRSRDVIHSFWIPAFLYKQDMIPYRENSFVVTPTREGVYAGKCAELCGEYHSGMLFNVKVVDRAEFDAAMDELRDKGQEGQLPVEGYSRLQDPQSTAATTEGEN